MKLAILLITTILMIGIVSAACTDSDGGKNKYEFGEVTEDEETFSDECDGENIKEYFCSIEEKGIYTILPCVNGCNDSACQLANNPPVARAPEEAEDTTAQIYFYAIAIIIIVGLYIYWFKIRKKKKKW